MSARLQMVVFDMDDTLYPEREFVLGGFRAAADSLDRITGRVTGAYDVFVEVMERQGVGKVFDEGLPRLGVEPGPDLIEALVTAFREHRPALRPHAGVRELLRDLRARGVRLGLVTDGPLAVQQAKWAALGLQDLFEVVVFADAIAGKASWKPTPAPYDEVERLSGLSGGALGYVGDRPWKDFPIPDQRGWRTARVRFDCAFHRDSPDIAPGRPEARTVTELRAILSGWL